MIIKDVQHSDLSEQLRELDTRRECNIEQAKSIIGICEVLRLMTTEAGTRESHCKERKEGIVKTLVHQATILDLILERDLVQLNQ